MMILLALLEKMIMLIAMLEKKMIMLIALLENDNVDCFDKY